MVSVNKSSTVKPTGTSTVMEVSHTGPTPLLVTVAVITVWSPAAGVGLLAVRLMAGAGSAYTTAALALPLLLPSIMTAATFSGVPLVMAGSRVPCATTTNRNVLLVASLSSVTVTVPSMKLNAWPEVPPSAALVGSVPTVPTKPVLSSDTDCNAMPAGGVSITTTLLLVPSGTVTSMW